MAHFISLNNIYSNCLVSTPSGTVNTVTSHNTELSYALEVSRANNNQKWSSSPLFPYLDYALKLGVPHGTVVWYDTCERGLF